MREINTSDINSSPSRFNVDGGFTLEKYHKIITHLQVSI